MPYRIVVPYDYGPDADRALEWGAALIKSAGGSLVLLHVILFPAPPIPKVPMIPALRPTEDPDASMARLRDAAIRLGVPAEFDVFTTSDAGPGIVRRAAELGADLIAIGGGTGRGGLSRALRESVIDHVVWHASSPVVVIRSSKAGAGEGSATTA
jgi:nucleotide-binding universal stress UspA family protein